MINQISSKEVAKVYPIQLNESRTKLKESNLPQVSEPGRFVFSGVRLPAALLLDLPWFGLRAYQDGA